MAQWIEQGTTKAPVTEYAGLLTRAAIRETLGPPVQAFTLHDGGTLFATTRSPEVVGGPLTANMRASFLCGWLVFGPAIRTLPGEKIEWHEPTKALEN